MWSAGFFFWLARVIHGFMVMKAVPKFSDYAFQGWASALALTWDIDSFRHHSCVESPAFLGISWIPLFHLFAHISCSIWKLISGVCTEIVGQNSESHCYLRLQCHTFQLEANSLNNVGMVWVRAGKISSMNVVKYKKYKLLETCCIAEMSTAQCNIDLISKFMVNCA